LVTERVPETPEELYARVRGEGLRMPLVDEWETWPFEGELRPRELQPPVDVERPRLGEDPADCWRCQKADEHAIWSDERWLVTPIPEPNGLPCVVLLFPRRHVDLGDLDDEEAADLGRMLVRVERAVSTVPDVGRVHVCRWGDGSYHLHYWFLARPARFPQLIGSFAAIWDDILPPTPQDVWDENLAIVARGLSE
jgi:diadenosine tetraphosphate (Ap4A) HIT family hydrolase